MEANGSVNSSDGIDDDTRPEDSSSRLSLGSSPSELSEEEDEANNPTNPDDDFPLDDGDGSLTPTDKIIMDDEEDEEETDEIIINRQRDPLLPPEEFDDDGLFEDSSDTLSNAPMDIDEREDEDDEEPFSSLSSVPAPLSPEPHHDQNEDDHDENEAEIDNGKLLLEEQHSILDDPTPSENKVKKEEEAPKQQKQKQVSKSKKRKGQTQEEDEEDEEAEEEPEEKQEPSPPPAPLLRREKKTNKRNKNKKNCNNTNNNNSTTTSSEENSSSTPTTTHSATPNDTHSTSKENEKPSTVNIGKKRRGSVALEQEEWQQRRTSKLLENKEAMAGLANALENAEAQQQQQQSSESPQSQQPLSTPTTSEQKSDSVKEEEDEDNHKVPKEVSSLPERGESSYNNDNTTSAMNTDEHSMNGQQLIDSDKEEQEDDKSSNKEDQRPPKAPPQQQISQEVEEERVVHSRNENDDQEYQRCHSEALDALTRIEVDFARLRDKMYQERMSELNEEALMIASGTHPELVTMMETIERKKNQRIQTAEAWRKYKRISYRQQFEGLEYQANIDYVAGKNTLRRDILGSLNRKRWDLDSERDKLNEPLTDADRVPDPTLLQQRKRGLLDESRDLQRITQSVGFPVAPRTTGIAVKSVEEDLIALGLLDAQSLSSTSQERQQLGTGSSSSSSGMNHHQHPTGKSTIASSSSQYQPVGRPPSSITTPSATMTTTKKVLDTSLTNHGYQQSPTVHVYSFQGQLHYHGEVFRKGDQFTVVDANAGRYNAKLLSATDTEVHIQRTDGSKTKLSFIQMSRGKYQIYPKHS